jgi:hypothetical protein
MKGTRDRSRAGWRAGRANPSAAAKLKIGGLLGAVAIMVAGCISTDADARKDVQTKAGTQTQPQDAPAKPRYYGGPKSPMFPG